MLQTHADREGEKLVDLFCSFNVFFNLCFLLLKKKINKNNNEQFPCFNFLVSILVLFSALSAFAADSGTNRYKRSDDIPALQTVMEDHSQKLAEHTAQLTALQNKLSEYDTLYEIICMDTF